LSQGGNQNAKPSTVTNRVAAYRVKAGSMSMPQAGSFTGIAQGPESKGHQLLQPYTAVSPDLRQHAVVVGPNQADQT